MTTALLAGLAADPIAVVGTALLIILSVAGLSCWGGRALRRRRTRAGRADGRAIRQDVRRFVRDQLTDEQLAEQIAAWRRDDEMGAGR